MPYKGYKIPKEKGGIKQDERPLINIFNNIYADSYAVSRSGRVRNLRTGTIVKPTIDSVHGEYKYSGVTLHKKGYRPKHVSLGRLVCSVFNGPMPGDGSTYDADHIDGNPQNNCADNLRWLTREENGQLENKPNQKKKVHSVRLYYADTCELYKEFPSLNSAATYLGLYSRGRRAAGCGTGLIVRYCNEAPPSTPKKYNKKYKLFINNDTDYLLFKSLNEAIKYLGVPYPKVHPERHTHKYGLIEVSLKEYYSEFEKIANGEKHHLYAYLHERKKVYTQKHSGEVQALQYSIDNIEVANIRTQEDRAILRKVQEKINTLLQQTINIAA